MSQTLESKSYYAPRMPDFSLAVRLNLSVVDRLEVEIVEAFRSIPKRGLEIGGVLLGQIDKAGGNLVIEDYEVVESVHLYGPSYQLSPADRSAFQDAVRRRRSEPTRKLYPVGFFRSQTRSGLDFDDQDVGIAREVFSDHPFVCLLVQPCAIAPSVAEIGLWWEGGLRSALTFPFRIAALREGGFPLQAISLNSADTRESMPAAELSEPAPVNLPPAPIAASANPSISRKAHVAVWIRLIRTAAALSSMAALVAAGASLIRSRRFAPVPVLQKTPAPAPQADDEGLSLSVQRRNGSAILSWSNATAAVRQAEYGLLTIVDSGTPQELRLDRTELGIGRIVYVPRSNDVSFRMELFPLAKSSTQSIESSGEGSSGALGPPSQLKDKEVTEKSFQTNQTVRRAQRRVAEAQIGSRTRFGNPAVNTAQPERAEVPNGIRADVPPVADIVPPSAPDRARDLAGSNPAPSSISDRLLLVSASVEPIGRTGVRRILNDLSPKNVIRFYSARAAVVHARALQQIQPDVPSGLLPDNQNPKKVDIKITIGSDGEVVRAVLSSPGDQGDPIAEAVLRAAFQWRFEPARIGDHAVEEKALLHFTLQYEGS